MDFRILGPLEVLDEGRQVALVGSKQRALLGLLLVNAGETLSTDRLIDELWGERPPATAAKTVQVHISRLRKALAAGGGNASEGVVVTHEHGYQLEIDPEHLDSRRFERLLAEGRRELAANRPESAAPVLERALSLWRGRPLADLAYEAFAQGEIARLEDLRVAAVEQLIDAKLALGRHVEVIGELESLISDYPYRERLRAQLMLALYRSDRQADALQAYQDARRSLTEELGIEPGERLRELERAILAQDPELALPAPEAVELRQEVGPEPAAAERAVAVAPLDSGAPTPAARRLVSIVFADLVGSTGLAEQLDPESMHGLLDRYTEVCSAVIERHGGAVEGFIGDAVVGVFGATELHEDDALRAVRVAVELREAGAAMSAEFERDRGVEIAMKFGVESGEVFLGAGTRRSHFAAGDAFNVASRLEGMAAPGEILLGENVYALVQDDVRVEPLEPLALRGRTAKVQAWRLLGLLDDQMWLRQSGSPFVGRARELEQLRVALARVRAERVCHAVTVVGPAGIGKSRLARELAADVDEDATVVVGRCPAYGEGVTYRPLAEIVGQLGGSNPRQRVNELLEGDEPIAQLVLGAIGLSDGAAHPEETFWAVRRLLERVAQSGPLVVIFDDIHWAEPTLIDLLDYLVAFSSGHPILLVCLARHDFLEAHPAWVAPQSNRSLLTLAALPDTEARRLVEGAGTGELWSRTAARIVETAEGNPLFLEQLVAVGAEGGEAALPSSIQAVLAARIDGLEPGERALLEHASVQGRSFYAGAVAHVLERDSSEISPQLVSLVHKQLIRSERSDLPGEDAFRFAHVLIREAAYQGLPKQRRAELHEHLAEWLQGRAGAEDETLGHHLGEAYRCRAELGAVGEREQALASAAAARLASAADAALLRGDPPAGARLLERAASLLERDAGACGELLPALGAALFEAGRMSDATRVLEEAIARAPEPRLRARAQIERELVRLETEMNVGTEQEQGVITAAMPVLEGEGDDYGMCRVWFLRGRLAWELGHAALADEAWREAAEYAQRARRQRELFEVIGWRGLAAVLGPTPVDEAIGDCEAFRELVRASPIATASTLNPLAVLHAMKGEFEIAEELLEQAGEMLHELGGIGSGVSHLETFVRLLAGQPALAEARLRADVETLSSMNAEAALATTTALLAQVVYAQGRTQEAGELSRMSERRAAAEDTTTQVLWRGVQAKVLASEDRCDEAEALAREAVALAEPTDLLLHRGDAMLDLAEVLRTCGRTEESDHAARTALQLHELKGNLAAAARARPLLSHRPGGE